VFGQRKRREAEAEAARESERLALFARLAERPEYICPFLGLAGERTVYVEGVSDEHRCYAFGEPAPLSAEQQTRVCQERGYGNCPRYLRGVLVIPTEELEALRRARPELAPPPASLAATERRRRRPVVLVALVALLLIGGGAGAAFLLLGPRGVAYVSPTPDPTLSPAPSVAPSPTPTEAPPTATPVPSPTPIVLPSSGASIPPLPTPGPDDEFVGYAVFVTAGDFPVTRLNDDDEIVGTHTAEFSRVSAAPVDLIEVAGERYWKTLIGVYRDLAYSTPKSGDFAIFETYESPDGEARFRRLPDEDR
jgi:hypothetical protein